MRQTATWIRHPQRLVDASTRAHGPLFTIRVFGTEMVMHSSPELVQELLSQPSDVLAAGRANAFLSPVVGRRSLLLLDGEEHLSMRRAQLPAFHGERLKAYERAMQQIAIERIARWPLEREIAAWPRMQSITLDVIVRVIFGIEDPARAVEVREAVRSLLSLSTRPALFGLAAAAGVIAGQRPTDSTLLARPVVRLRDRLGRLLVEEIDRRRAAGEEDRGDVLSMLLAARTEAGEPLPEAVIRDQLITLLVAGHETTATSLAWAVERIARHPELQDQLAAEALDGRHELIDATVKETLRLRPVLPVFVREVRQPVTVGGFEHQPGTLLAGATIALHRNRSIYPDADRFRPERFLADDAPGTYAWTPFGGGVRRCIGASFALLEMRIVLSALLAERRIEPVGDRSEQVRRRAIVLAPSRQGQVRVPLRRAVRAPSKDAAHTSAG